MYLDPELVVPDPDISIRDGAIAPWEKRFSGWYHQTLEALAKAYKFDIRLPFKDLPQKAKDVVLERLGRPAGRLLVGGRRREKAQLPESVRRGAQQPGAAPPGKRVGDGARGTGEVHGRHAVPDLPGCPAQEGGALRPSRRPEHPAGDCALHQGFPHLLQHRLVFREGGDIARAAY